MRSKFLYFLIAAKFFLIVMTLVLWLGKSYSVNQVREILLLISPLFVTNVTLAINYFLDQKEEEQKTSISAVVVRIFYIFILFYVLFLTFMLLYYSTLSGDDKAFEALKQWIGFSEITFGCFIGLIFKKIFSDK